MQNAILALSVSFGTGYFSMTSYFLLFGKISLSVHLCPRKVTSCLKNENYSGCNLRLFFLHKSKTFVGFWIMCFSEHPMTIRSSIYKNAWEGSIPENAVVIILWKGLGAIFKPYGNAWSVKSHGWLKKTLFLEFLRVLFDETLTLNLNKRSFSSS